MFSHIIMTCALIICCATIWFLIQNQMTLHDRVLLLYEVGRCPDILVSLEIITYDQHLIRRVFFLDPWRLYPEHIAEIGYEIS